VIPLRVRKKRVVQNPVTAGLLLFQKFNLSFYGKIFLGKLLFEFLHFGFLIIELDRDQMQVHIDVHMFHPVNAPQDSPYPGGAVFSPATGDTELDHPLGRKCRLIGSKQDQQTAHQHETHCQPILP
jgi:hypothetical protein